MDQYSLSFSFLPVHTLFLLSLQCLTLSLFSGIVLHRLHPLFCLFRCFILPSYSHTFLYLVQPLFSLFKCFIFLCVFYFLAFYTASPLFPLTFDFPLVLSHYSVMFSAFYLCHVVFPFQFVLSGLLGKLGAFYF